MYVCVCVQVKFFILYNFLVEQYWWLLVNITIHFSLFTTEFLLHKVQTIKLILKKKSRKVCHCSWLFLIFVAEPKIKSRWWTILLLYMYDITQYLQLILAGKITWKLQITVNTEPAAAATIYESIYFEKRQAERIAPKSVYAKSHIFDSKSVDTVTAWQIKSNKSYTNNKWLFHISSCYFVF